MSALWLALFGIALFAAGCMVGALAGYDRGYVDAHHPGGMRSPDDEESA